MDSVQNQFSGISSPKLRAAWAVIRLATAAALIVAITAQVTRTVQYAREAHLDLAAVLSNHFSYFTVLSTSLASATLLISGIWSWRARRTGASEPRWISVLMLCIGSAMVITGIVYNLLLRGGVPEPDTVNWASELKHVVAPIVCAIDLVLHVARRPYRWSDVAIVLIYPIVWAVYTLLRGEMVANPETGAAWWYPYGFLDPHRAAGGYVGVALYVVGIALALALIAAISVWISRRAGRMSVT